MTFEAEPWTKQYYIFTCIATLLFFIPCGFIGLLHFMYARTMYVIGNKNVAENKRQQATCCIVWTVLIFIAVAITVTVVVIEYAN